MQTVSSMLNRKKNYIYIYITLYLYIFFLSQFLVQSSRTAEYTDCIISEGYDSPNKCDGYNTKQSDGDVGAIGNAEYLFIAITPWSTLAW